MAHEIKVTKKVLPEARKLLAEMGSGDFQTDAFTGVGQGTMDRIKRKNIGDVYIVRRDDGLWVANLTLKKMPVGTPTAIGTPEAHALPSKDEALQDGARFLAYALWLAERNAARPSRPDDVRHFDLEGLEIALPAHAVEQAHGRLRQAGEPLEAAPLEARMLERLDRDFPEAVDEAGWRALPEDERELYVALACALLTHGIFRIRRDDPARAAARTPPESSARH